MNEKKLIVLVDDYVVLLELTKKSLEGLGYEVKTADNGDAGYQLVADLCHDGRHPDLIISDVNMPVDGLAMSRMLKKDERCSSIPILFLSGALKGYEEDQLREHSPYFEWKPLPIDKLQEKIEMIIATNPQPAPVTTINAETIRSS